ncbi:hypothetical protein HHL28_13190 [Aerophototrophica crusticola]|uniref:Uncharacterized protein n=1 Tax=Aerophototrophica crusticola TaxID=1709002 RepID=A0A858R8X4_9PROT|nr:hypothetical protein HHL28_13190 [Rhodospirillaceae bacterium B3]
MTKGTKDTQQDKHDSGGPGKAARSGHLEDGKLGNALNQNQSPADKERRPRPGDDDTVADA